jgi:hypothetical protein
LTSLEKSVDELLKEKDKPKAKTSSDLTPQIAKRAYELYEQQGRKSDSAIQNWSQAEQEVRNPKVKVEPKPEIKAEPKPEAKVEAKPETKAEPKPEAKVGAKPETKAEPKPEAKVEANPETKAEPKPEAKVEAKAEPKLDEPKPKTKSQ